jgi:hypothetical protein
MSFSLKVYRNSICRLRVKIYLFEVRNSQKAIPFYSINSIALSTLRRMKFIINSAPPRLWDTLAISCCKKSSVQIRESGITLNLIISKTGNVALLFRKYIKQK